MTHAFGTLPIQPETKSVLYVPPRSMDGLVQIVFEKQRKDLKRAALAALEALKNPPANSPAQRDLRWASSHKNAEEIQGVFGMGDEAVARILHAADQHLQATKAILASESRIPLPAMTCIRAIHEAVLTICYMTDPDIVPAARLTRAAAGFLASINGGIPVLTELRGTAVHPGRLTKATKSRDDAIRLFETMGISVQRKNTGAPINVEYSGHKANLVTKSTDLSKKYAPSLHFMYALNSGAAHSQPWFLEGMNGSWESILRGAALPILDLSDTLAASILAYAGLPSEDYHKLTHSRRVAVFKKAGDTSLFVDWQTYRHDLGRTIKPDMVP